MSSLDQKLANFRTWFQKNGGTIHDAVKFTYDDEQGVHLKATSLIAPGTAIITCPHALTISAINSTGRLPDFPSHLPDHIEGLPSQLLSAVPRAQSLAAAWLCLHRSLGSSSFWEPYIEILPQIPGKEPPDTGIGIIDTPLTWPAESRQFFAASPLEKGTADLEALWKADWDSWGSLVALWAQEQGLNIDWDDYLWALTMLGSRSFSSAILEHVTYGDKGLTTQFDPDALLYPGMDMLNHSPTTLNRWSYDSHGFTLVCNDQVNHGDEISNTYGAKNNGQLMLSYGFALPSNPHDAFPLKHAQSSSPKHAPPQKTEASKASGITTDKPSVVPEPCGPDNATFYIRWSRGSADLPGYADGIFSGIPTELLNRLTLAQATSSERVAIESIQSDTSQLLLYRLSARAFLDLVSLLALRTDADLLRLQPAIALIPSVTDTDARRNAHKQLAWTYMTSLFTLLTEHRERLHAAIATSLSSFPTVFVRLGPMFANMFMADSVVFASFVRGIGLEFDDDAPTQDALDLTPKLAAACQDEGAEDAWLACLGLSQLYTQIAPETRTWLEARPAPPSEGAEGDEVDGLVAHAAEYIEGCSARDSGPAWSTAWTPELLRKACWAVRSSTVAVVDPDRPGRREVVLVREGQCGDAALMAKLLALQ